MNNLGVPEIHKYVKRLIIIIITIMKRELRNIDEHSSSLKTNHEVNEGEQYRSFSFISGKIKRQIMNTYENKSVVLLLQ